MIGHGAKLASKPNMTGGNYSAHFDKVVGIDLAGEGSYNMIQLQVPGHQRCTLGRATLNCEASLAYHMLAEEVTTPLLRQLVPDPRHSWGQVYTEHPLVKASEASDTVLPVALYLDGVAFQKRDTTTGFWLINLRTGRRYLLFCLRKRQVCRCAGVGAKAGAVCGWCSPVLHGSWTHWRLACTLPLRQAIAPGLLIAPRLLWQASP